MQSGQTKWCKNEKCTNSMCTGQCTEAKCPCGDKKCCANAVDHLLSDETTIGFITDKVYETFEKCKGKKPDVECVEKSINSALEKAGSKCRVGKSDIHHALKSINDMPEKATKEDISKTIKHFLEEKKNEWESAK